MTRRFVRDLHARGLPVVEPTFNPRVLLDGVSSTANFADYATPVARMALLELLITIDKSFHAAPA